ncbi:MAG: nitroreductase family deazaflavin-dependent oxidoreductase [Chloroflexota bacterium]|nr:MAG: nitroreductase family deazaflavin-dependent oxidoreductase [Chloroflexota bacterium]
MLMKQLWKMFVAVHVFLYRSTGGRIGNFNREQFGILLLTTIGKKTGKSRTSTLGYFPEDSYYVVIASNAGMDYHPSWYSNLKRNPQVEIQINNNRMRARAEAVTGAERERLWAKLKTIAPNYANYEKRTTREIPLVALYPEEELGKNKI